MTGETTEEQVRTVTQELAALRETVTQELAALRETVTQELAALREELADERFRRRVLSGRFDAHEGSTP